MKKRCDLLPDFLKPDDKAGHLHAAAGTSCTGANQHQPHQDRLGKLRPLIKIHRRKARGRDDGTNLERRMMKRVKQCREHGTDIDGDHQNGTCNDSKIYSRLVTLERLFPFADGEQVIHVKIYTKQDHEHSDHTL